MEQKLTLEGKTKRIIFESALVLGITLSSPPLLSGLVGFPSTYMALKNQETPRGKEIAEGIIKDYQEAPIWLKSLMYGDYNASKLYLSKVDKQ